MSERINKFCTSLQNHLNALEARAISLKASLQAASGHAEDALRKKLDQAEKKVQSQKEAVARAKVSVQNWLEQKKTEAQATVDHWKANHEAKKLAHRADKAEEHAAAAIILAQVTLDEAEHAVLEAIAARLDADAVTVG